MFLNRFVCRSFPSIPNVQSKIVASTQFLNNHIELFSCRRFSNSTFGRHNDPFLPFRGKNSNNRLSRNVSECTKKLTHTDAQNFKLLTRREKRQVLTWDPELHKLEMQKLGVVMDPLEAEDNEAKELRLQTERAQQKGVLTEIECQLQDPRLELYAIVQITGRQYKVSEGDILIIQGYWAPEVGDGLRFEKVLLFGGKDFTLVGQPMVDWAKFRVEGTIIEKTLSDMKLHFTLRKRQNYRRMYFNKFPYTMVRITKVGYEPHLDSKQK